MTISMITQQNSLVDLILIMIFLYCVSIWMNYERQIIQLTY